MLEPADGPPPLGAGRPAEPEGRPPGATGGPVRGAAPVPDPGALPDGGSTSYAFTPECTNPNSWWAISPTVAGSDRRLASAESRLSEAFTRLSWAAVDARARRWDRSSDTGKLVLTTSAARSRHARSTNRDRLAELAFPDDPFPGEDPFPEDAAFLADPAFPDDNPFPDDPIRPAERCPPARAAPGLTGLPGLVERAERCDRAER
ncbi:MAG: hypothetical protein ACYCUF_13180 [Acidimicrobiales bacterium]